MGNIGQVQRIQKERDDEQQDRDDLRRTLQGDEELPEEFRHAALMLLQEPVAEVGDGCSQCGCAERDPSEEGEFVGDCRILAAGAHEDQRQKKKDQIIILL